MPSDKRPIQTALNQRHPEAGVHKMSHGTQAYSAPTARERLKHRMRPLPLTQLPLSEHPTSLPQAPQCLIEAQEHCPLRLFPLIYFLFPPSLPRLLWGCFYIQKLGFDSPLNITLVPVLLFIMHSTRLCLLVEWFATVLSCMIISILQLSEIAL